MTRGQPSKLKYIGAWLLAALASNILHVILDVFLADTMVEDVSDLNFYLFVGSALSIPISVGTFILVYRLFSSLNVKRVMPYLYVLGTLGALANMGRVASELKEFGLDLSIFFGSSLMALIASLYLIRSYFIKKPARWF